MPTPYGDPTFQYRPRVARPVSGGRANGIFQKKAWRKIRGLLKPKRCPHCQTFTRQLPVPGKNFLVKFFDFRKRENQIGAVSRRQCLACKGEFGGPEGYKPHAA